MIFWRKKREKNEEKEENLTQKEQIIALKARITRLESEVLDIMTAQEIIRNKVLRKIQSKKQPEEEESAQEWAGIPITKPF